MADLLETPVERPAGLETTALGAAFHAGLAVGVWSGLDAIAATWQRERLFVPAMDAGHRAGLVARWHDAVARTLSKPGPAA
jgi:glycerol kinase